MASLMRMQFLTYSNARNLCYYLHMVRLRKTQAFGERLATLRHARAWTQRELANKIGIDQPFMSKIEAGKHDPGMKLLASIAQAFGLTLSELFEGVTP
jgi:putative transcriptional regulator